MNFTGLELFKPPEPSKEEVIYKKLSQTMSELQPIAFLLSATVVLATFSKTNSLQGNLVTSQIASACFFFAYIEMVSFKLTNFKWFLRCGLITLSLGLYFIFQIILGMMSTVLYQLVTINIFILYIIILGFILIINHFSLTLIKNAVFHRVLKYLHYTVIALIIIPLFTQITKINLLHHFIAGISVMYIVAIIIATSFIISILIILISGIYIGLKN
jgi:hypothetical protein